MIVYLVNTSSDKAVFYEAIQLKTANFFDELIINGKQTIIHSTNRSGPLEKTFLLLPLRMLYKTLLFLGTFKILTLMHDVLVTMHTNTNLAKLIG